jgi:hypothetical protein
MYRCSLLLMGLGLVSVSCGSPGELDESRFPDVYTDVGDGSGGTQTGIAGTGGTAPVGGAGGSGVVGGTGGTGGTGVVGGSAGTGGTGSQAGAGSTGGCPDDISVLLNRPGNQGGCAGDMCHVPGVTAPDLISPGVETRLFNVASTCMDRPYIGATDSYLKEKITATSPCGGTFPMPLFTPNALNATDEACIVEWIDEVAAGQ